MTGKTGAIRAGRAFVEAYLDTGQLDKDITKLRGKFKRFSQQIGAIGGTIAGLGVAIVTPLAMAVKKLADTGFELRKLSSQLGMSVEALSALEFAAGQSGVELEDLSGALEELNIRLGEAVQDGTGPLAESFKKLGLNAAELAKMKPEERFKKIAQAIADIRNETDRQFLADEIFGGDAFKILPLLRQGAAGIEELMNKAEELGFVMDSKTAAAADELSTSMNQLEQGGKALAVTLGTGLLPMANDFAAWLKEVVPEVREWISENRETVELLAKLGGVLLIVGGGLIGMAAAISAATTVLGAMQTAITAVNANLARTQALARVAFAITAIVWFATETYKASEAVKDLNRELRRASDLNDEIAKRQQQGGEKTLGTAAGLKGQQKSDFLASEIEKANREIIFMEGSIKRQRKSVDELAPTWKSAWQAGKATHQEAKEELDAINERLEKRKKHLEDLKSAKVKNDKAVAEAAKRPPEQVKKIESAINRLNEELETFGMTAAQKTIRELHKLGATEEELSQARQKLMEISRQQAEAERRKAVEEQARMKMEEQRRKREQAAQEAQRKAENIQAFLKRIKDQIEIAKLKPEDRAKARELQELKSLGANEQELKLAAKGIDIRNKLLADPEEAQKQKFATEGNDQQGTFSALASRAFFSGGGGPLNEIKEATKQTAKHTKKIAKNSGPQKFQ